MASPFTPRTLFPNLPNLPRSYFLGHHKSALTKLRSAVKDTDVVIEIRDYRLPFTSINPLFESALTGIRRWIVYSKVDLGKPRPDSLRLHRATPGDESILRQWHEQNGQLAFFSGLYSPHKKGASTILKTLEVIQGEAARAGTNLTGIRVIVVGMPNIGKSTLINELHSYSTKNEESRPWKARQAKKKKVAHTNMGPGTTRAFSEYIKVIEGGTEKLPEYAFPKPPVYLRDTPGVFVPYVPDDEAMLKLALVGSIKHNVIADMVLADYLLYRLNLNDPASYSGYCPPTNEVTQLCEAVARRHGRLSKGGVPMLDWAAETLVREFQRGDLARFVLDDVNEHALREYEDRQRTEPVKSMSQLKKMDKAMKLERKRLKYAEARA